MHNSRQKAFEEISKVVPRSKQIFIEQRQTPPQTYSLEFPKSYDTFVTTKKDYEHWKKLVLKRGKFFDTSHDNKNLKEDVKDIKNYEIVYGSSQPASGSNPQEDLKMWSGQKNGNYGIDLDTKSSPLNQNHFKTWEEALKFMYDNFAYLPSESDLVKKWRFPADTVKRLSNYRKSLGK
ncbi:hypothetical protein [Xylocopilactobacillus apis]|uniref:Uncharacterized protein n=1 Tax=Xylocopilactobacillus apis TaxID=2932183 RepID=A0AAU9CZL1_9LACO|nr:hypothetical protein [Xylocopilactobacillus apis]BDR56713.1 hypothetical protein KIMC2_12750 [Xylocopilactobacillus apis]